jgi:hypothetical protein
MVVKGSLMEDSDWCVAVFRCEPADVRQVLVSFYGFVKDLEGVKSLHFIIRDRLELDVVFSFRVLVDSKDNQIVKSKINYKLGTLMPRDLFAVDPDTKDPLEKYVAWSPNGEISKYGPKKFTQYCDFLSRMSRLILQMVRKKYFDSTERVELAHATAGMLGCTEYGILSTEHWEVGYYDRIDDRYCQYVRRRFRSQRSEKQD